MAQPKTLMFASGSAEGGGSGFENCVHKTYDRIFDTKIVGVVSNHEYGGVRQRADTLRIPFIHFPGPWTEEEYRRIARDSGAEFFAFSGWIKHVVGIDPRLGFNIHPGDLPSFGGKGMYGHHVHEAVMAAYARGEVDHSALCMHFVTAEYDRGPLFFRFNVNIRSGDTPDSLGKRVNAWEHRWQPEISNLVVHREIQWDGTNPDSLQVPRGYEINRYE